MNEYFFLFGLAFVWLCFAVVQDLRTREIANWLNFSLLVIALGYRGVYSILNNVPEFFYWGLAGMVFFVSLSYLLYFGRGFAGGDAKLLMAIGPVMPFMSFYDIIYWGLAFVFVLFLGGSMYSLVYTVVLISGKFGKFKKEFSRYLESSKMFVFACAGIAVCAFVLFSFVSSFMYGAVIGGLVLLLPFLYAYAKSVENVCMIELVPASRLTEGDWLVNDVRVGSRVIKKNVQGLNAQEIAFLRKRKVSVMIKQGIPFSPAFLIAFLAMVSFFLTRGFY